MSDYLIYAEGDSFGRGDKGSAADKDNNVNYWIVRDEVRGSFKDNDGVILLYVREGAGVDKVSNCWIRGSCYN